jgi:hypothetical protein
MIAEFGNPMITGRSRLTTYHHDPGASYQYVRRQTILQYSCAQGLCVHHGWRTRRVRLSEQLADAVAAADPLEQHFG